MLTNPKRNQSSDGHSRAARTLSPQIGGGETKKREPQADGEGVAVLPTPMNGCLPSWRPGRTAAGREDRFVMAPRVQIAARGAEPVTEATLQHGEQRFEFLDVVAGVAVDGVGT